MKIPSCAIEGTFTALRKCLHRSMKVSSQKQAFTEIIAGNRDHGKFMPSA